MAARELAVIRLEDDDGTVGYGEAAPLEPYDGVSVDEVVEALRDGPPGARRSAAGPRGVGAGASWTSRARASGRPLGEPGADAIPVNLTLPAGPPDEVAEAAAQGVRDGYSCFKLKVGLPDDAERVAAVREAVGSWPALRVDANGAWSAGEAVEAIDGAGEPTTSSWWSSRARRSRSWPRCGARGRTCRWPPTSRSPAQPTCAPPPRSGACDAVNVKLAGSGGFGPPGTRCGPRARTGLGAWLSSTLDGPWGIAAALQLAAGRAPVAGMRAGHAGACSTPRWRVRCRRPTGA